MEDNDDLLRIKQLEFSLAECHKHLQHLKDQQNQEQHFDFLSNSALKFISFSETSEVLDYLTETLHSIQPSSVILANTVTEDQKYIRVFRIEGLEKSLLYRFADMLGYSIIGKEFLLIDNFKLMYQNIRLFEHYDGLASFSDSAVPPTVARIIEGLLGISHIFTIGLRGNNKILGNVHIFTLHNTTIEQPGVIETLVYQASIAYEKCLVLKELKEKSIRLEESNAAKDKFLSILAHDLRNPFNAIIGLSRLMSQSKSYHDPDEVKKMFTLIYENSKSSYELLENLLEWSKSQMGVIQMSKETLSIAEMFEQIKTELKSVAVQKEITLVFSSSVEQVVADKEMLRTVFRNLITNAIKFSQRGAEIKIIAEPVVSDIRFAVVDSGIGIENDKLDDIFRFTGKLQYDGTENEKGTGLGLILCKEFVEKHQGKIWVTSKKHMGSTFYFTIPR